MSAFHIMAGIVRLTGHSAQPDLLAWTVPVWLIQWLVPVWVSLAVAVAVYAVLDWVTDIACSQSRIPGVPQVSGWPIVGSLFSAGASQAVTFQKWARRYGPVYQVRLGTKRVVIVNSFAAARELWVDHMRATASRPTSYTFHNIVSASQGPTIGTTPWSHEYRTRRRASGRALNRPSVNTYIDTIDRECVAVVRALAEQTAYGANPELSPHDFFDGYSININLQLSYGTRLEDIERRLILEVFAVEKEICKIRSSDSLYQDYLPVLRWLPAPWWRRRAERVRKRRDKYMEFFLNNLVHDINSGRGRPCILRHLLDGSSKQPVTDVDVKSICLTMVSAGLDTVPAVLSAFVGHMSLPHGAMCQERAFQELCEAFPDGDAWHRVTEEPSLPYMRALINETLRMSTMPISLPRETIAPIRLKSGAVLPKGTILLLNSFAANFDATHFKNPSAFDPTRYLDPSASHELPHFSFGAGMRMCAGAHLVSRELLIAFARLIIAFRILPPSDPSDQFVCDPHHIYKRPSVMVMPVPAFRVRLEPRDPGRLHAWLDE